MIREKTKTTETVTRSVVGRGWERGREERTGDTKEIFRAVKLIYDTVAK